MKILITGGSGFLGQHLNVRLSKEFELLTLYNSHPGNCRDYNSVQTDIRDGDLLTKIFLDFRPDIVIHTAAESRTVSSLPAKEVFKINVTATATLATLCQSIKAKLVYISSDLVYAGYRGQMLKEDAKLVPVSLYAETKLMGEEKVKQISDDYVILRLALLYGFGLNHSISYFQKMYEDLSAGKEVILFTDQYRTPLEVTAAADIIAQLNSKNISGEIINCGGQERVSRYKLGEILCSCAGFDTRLLVPAKMNEVPGYPIVEDVSMNSDKLKSLGINPLSIKESINNILNKVRT